MTPQELLGWHQSQADNERRLMLKFEKRQQEHTSGYYWNTNKGHAARHRRNLGFHEQSVACLKQLMGLNNEH